MIQVIKILNTFWTKHPALLYACSSLLSCYIAYDGTSLLLIPLCLLLIPLLFQKFNHKRFILSLLIFLLFYAYSKSYYQFPDIADGSSVEGTAQITISSLSYKTTHFGKRWVYRGTMKFLDESEQNYLLPYAIHLAEKENLQRPTANQSYEVTGKLKKTGKSYIFSVKNDTPWYPIPKSWNLAEARYHAKMQLSNYVHKHIRYDQAATFLAGIATGDFDDRLMMNEFSRFGLQHIMAISGFHFAIIAGILSFFIRYLLPRHHTTLLMLLLLSGYFFFLGFGPSIMRAWLTITIALIGTLLEKQNSGLNSLGIAIFFILLYDPWLCQNLGFQFSVLTTASILLFSSIGNYACQQFFRKRSLYAILKMDLLNRHGYVISAILREAIALGIAVNVTALPMTLFVFHKFPWLSLVYNLFFPFLVSISMLFLIVGMAVSWLIPPLAELIHNLNSVYTQFSLNFTFQMPPVFDYYVRVSAFPVEWLTVYITLLVFVGIILKHWQEQKSCG